MVSTNSGSLNARARTPINFRYEPGASAGTAMRQMRPTWCRSSPEGKSIARSGAVPIAIPSRFTIRPRACGRSMTPSSTVLCRFSRSNTACQTARLSSVTPCPCSRSIRYLTASILPDTASPAINRSGCSMVDSAFVCPPAIPALDCACSGVFVVKLLFYSLLRVLVACRAIFALIRNLIQICGASEVQENRYMLL